MRRLLYQGLTLSCVVRSCQALKDVFAHVIVGNTYGYSQDNWARDIQAAAAARINGFALNIAYTDTTGGYVTPQMENAFNAADAAGFSLFFSFDYDAEGAWDAQTVINTINSYSGRASYYHYNAQPLASTFEGPGNAGDWGDIKGKTGCFFMPDYSSLGASSAAAAPYIDGLLSWDAWPDGAEPKSDEDDLSYMSALGGKPYMMPVSPWFYTNLAEPSYSKNWLWRGDNLWHRRWRQVFAVQPALVEILTWNDYGESHYVGPLPPDESAIPPSGQWYVNNMAHNAWLKDLPYYISQYQGTAPPDKSHITVWYRLNPASACSADGTTCNTATQGQTEMDPSICNIDRIFFTAFVASSATATITISIGGAETTLTSTSSGIFHSSVPFNGRSGDVIASGSASDGTVLGSVNGPAITTSCLNGNVNWNAWVGGS